MEVSRLLEQLVHHVVLLLQGLQMFLHFLLSLAELIYSSIVFRYTSIQLCFGLGRVK